MFKVKKECCERCLFSNSRIVSNKRKRDILNNCKENDNHFICHKTDNTCCKGFYDSFTTNMIRIAQRLNMVKFVD